MTTHLEHECVLVLQTAVQTLEEVWQLRAFNHMRVDVYEVPNVDERLSWPDTLLDCERKWLEVSGNDLL